MKQGNVVKIVVATHKKYRMPEDEMYLPVHVGAAGKNVDFGYQKDDSGINISYKNNSFCELTGLYWAWKNINADYIGLAHYRRHFSNGKNKNKWDCVLMYENIKPYLGKKDIFLPKKRHYYIESLYSHYAHTHYATQLDKTKEIIQVKCPEYAGSYERATKKTYGYMFNMFIMKRQWLDRYCTWLFDILFELENQIDIKNLSDYQKRCFGRISEIMLNVWLDYQISSNNISQEKIMEIPYIHMEDINWRKKGMAFLKAKFYHKKYEESF